MVKVNYDLLPVKTHYFFFMAAMGPILPFLPVIGKQLGVSEVVMGLIMSVIPILFLFAKPIFGFILDYFQSHRKTVFLTLVVSTTVFSALLWLVPEYKLVPVQQQVACGSILNCTDQVALVDGIDCWVTLSGEKTAALRLAADNTSYCAESTVVCQLGSMVHVSCQKRGLGFYSSTTFWMFVVLLSAASIGYNVSNSVSDAICFDVLGAGNEKKYGQQRVWGTVGFGLSALVGGYCVDWWSGPSQVKDYTPAYFMAVVFTSIDLLCCTKLKLPVLPRSQNILKDVLKLVQTPSIATFLLFAAFIGICESFIIFFLFWYLEDLAVTTGAMGHIKLLQGLTVAAETLVGEIVFFPLSGRILRWVGYRHCLSLCFLAYTLRLGLLSLIHNPWWALAVELLQEQVKYDRCVWQAGS
ncbi:major facilitator superfamily domain-containing protein 6-A isoform X4 [Homalodisca vitripennis]|uniref:major facilitator superfamily domain-containing protein 6-A isoform X4 n=1 Tax=Homalodisca vitripennis TaxID=197043 RepID=UPI001EEC3B0F|nr:major facilitator superfamily domain-containing protein 6-A isoform X4 [Homalodisca vitripennis]